MNFFRPGLVGTRWLLFASASFISLPSIGPLLQAVECVRDGQPVARIVVPAQPLPVETYAAGELQYHIKKSTGAQVVIVSEGSEVSPGTHIYLGHCRAAREAKLDPALLPGNGYFIKTVGEDLFITGNDSEGDPLHLDTHEGTLFAVYDILEREMGVHWLWPGPLGEVIPPRKDLSLDPTDAQVEPLLWFKQWREGNSPGERVWLKRQRFGRSIQPHYGHSFGNYWPRFGASHPEYFCMTPDGARGLDPSQDPGPEWVHMCVSSTVLVNQIIADWKAKGAPEFLNVCENDGWAGCACPTCLSWDEPDPENPIPFTERLAAAKRSFLGEEGRRDTWMLRLGSLSDRFARFWKRVADEALKTRRDVKVVSYVYDNYRKPPFKAMLESNVLCGLVPQESIFGYSKSDSDVFRRDWLGWERTGCRLFLRPNYTLQAPNFPAFYARALGEDLKFALAHGLKGADFDSLTGKYATQGPSLFMLATILNHPQASPDSVLDDFYGAFGPARQTVDDYFKLWESVYPNYSPAEQEEKIRARQKYGAGLYGPFYLLADEIFTPEIMQKGWLLLQTARSQTAGHALATARVEWLAKGLKHAELILNVTRAHEQSIDTQDKTGFLAAYQTLKQFRAANLDYDHINFAGLSGEERKWDLEAK